MSQLNLQLPETLHKQLTRLAEGEGVSLAQYVVYVLARQVDAAYSVRIISESQIEQQREEFDQWVASSTACSEIEAAEILAERKPVGSDPDLSEAAITRFQSIIDSRKTA